MNVMSDHTGDESRSPPSRNPSLRLPHGANPNPTQRHSFTEQLRGVPPSPRSGRQMSLSQAQIQELLNNPPTAGSADPTFAGRDWRGITIGELVNPDDLRFVELDTGVEAATNLLTDSGAPVLLIRSTSTEKSVVGTFDYRDLTQYLLFATGQLHPNEESLPIFQELAKKAKLGQRIPLKDAKNLGTKEPFVTLPHTADLTKAVETFGGGVHRIVVLKEGTNKVTGILSQSRLVKFLWENGRSFPTINDLYHQSIKDLGVGSQHVISINGDKPLKEALTLMNNEGVTSLAVVDHHDCVIGNISNVDVRLLTKSSSAPLLENTCIHFISVILSTRGMNDGKDSYPVFHVSPYSTLAHTVAKLVATKAHRMWIVDSPSPSSSGPPTPAAQPAVLHIPHQNSPQSMPPSHHTSTSGSSVSASIIPGVHMSGRLSGVVSLTDVLNVFARASGLHPLDPEETRRQRRRSSSSSIVRGSMDSARSSTMDLSKR